MINGIRKKLLLIASLVLLGGLLLAPATANAEEFDQNACATGTEAVCQRGQGDTPCAKNIEDCGTIKTIRAFVLLLGAFVGIAVVISIMIGGIQYAMSAGDSSKAAAARRRITNAIIALIVFFFLTAILNFAIPGGLR